MTTIHINNWIRFHSCSVSADQKSELGKIIRPPLMWEFFSSLPSRHSVRRIFWGQMTDNPLGHWNQWFFCVGDFLSDLKYERNFGGLLQITVHVVPGTSTCTGPGPGVVPVVLFFLPPSACICALVLKIKFFILRPWFFNEKRKKGELWKYL